MSAPAPSSPPAARPFRVLMVNDLPPGPGSGTEVHLARLLRGLAAAGHEVDCFTPTGPRRGVARLGDLWDPVTRRRLRARARGFDVVHVHNFCRELSAAVLGAAPDAACVLTVHDHRLFETDRPGDKWSPVTRATQAMTRVARDQVRRHVDAVMAVTPELATRLAASGIGPVHVVAPFADAPDGPWTAPVGRDVVYAGRLARSKGVHVLLAAFGDVVARVPDARLRFAGAGPDHDALVAAAGPLGERVRFEGLLDDAGVRALLAEARVVCVPSVGREGLPLVAVEAMLAGRPIVASDLPSLREALANGERGVLVPPDDRAALASAITKLLTDDTAAADHGRAARAFAERELTTEHAVRQTEAVYAEAVARHG